MPEIAVESVVSVSSADPRHRAENLLHPDGGGRWRSGGGGEKRISAVLVLQRPQRIDSVHIGNDGAAFVELLVALGGGDFQVLLPTAAFLSPSESRCGAALQRVRIFGPTALLGGAQGGQWDRVKVVCTQPYCTTRPFGLSFIRLFSPPTDGGTETETTAQRWGPFRLREDLGSDAALRPGQLFYRRPLEPAPPQPPPGPSYAVAALQTPKPSAPPKRRSDAAGCAPPKNPQKTPPKEPPKTPKDPRGGEESVEGGGDPIKGGGDPIKGGGDPIKGGGDPIEGGGDPVKGGGVLGGVVVALSGFTHPLRGRLRAAAIAMGAKYRPQWGPDCTHLVCAFPRTPKAAAARAMGGVVVTPTWIWDCQRLHKRLPCEPYLLDGSASSGSDGEEEPTEAPPTTHQRPAHVGGATTAKPRPPTPPSSNGDTPEGDAEDSAGDTEDELRRVTSLPPDDPYGGSTEENTDSDDDPIPPLPDFFEDKTFFLYGDFGAPERRRLQRFVIAFGGTVAPYMSEAVTHVVTAQDWDSTFEEALELNPALQFVRPRWVLLCAERLRPLPPQPYAVVPRDVTVTSP